MLLLITLDDAHPPMMLTTCVVATCDRHVMIHDELSGRAGVVDKHLRESRGSFACKY